MSQEITIKQSISVDKGNLSVSENYSFAADLATARRTGDTQNIGTAYEALTIGSDVTTAGGYARIQNLDTTNYVDIGAVASSTFIPLLRLLPGEAFIVRLATLTLYAQAHTASCDLDYMIFAA